MNIEVVFALPDRQVLVALDVDKGTTVEAAVALSNKVTAKTMLDFTDAIKALRAEGGGG